MTAVAQDESFCRYMIADAELYRQIVQSPGPRGAIYRLQCLADPGQGSRFRHVTRLLGVDESGVLYIGSSGNVCNRVGGDLRKALCAAAEQQGYSHSGCHPAGRPYRNPRIREMYPFEMLCVTIQAIAATGDHYRAEQTALDEYEERFGEGPPFNERRRT